MLLIFSLIDDQNWDKLKQYLYTNDYRSRLSLVEMNEEGQNIFHAACGKKDIPSDIIILLFQANIEALFTLSKSNSLPLHYACETGSSSTVKVLLQLAPANVSFRLQHRFLDINERTPMERAWLEYFVSNNPSCQKSAPKLEHVLKNFQDMDSITSICDLSGKLLDLWEKTATILFFRSTNSVENSSSRYIIHAIARSGGGDTCWCPSIVMWFALKMFGDQVCCQDEHGDLPIHIAASSPVHKILYVPEKLVGKNISRDINRSVIEMLIQYYPNSVKIENTQKRLPLNIAIDSSQRWENGINCLLRAYPDSLDIADGKTHLFPFMLAASSHSETIESVRPAHFPSHSTLSLQSIGNNSLDLVYNLLRSNPMNVRCAGTFARI